MNPCSNCGVPAPAKTRFHHLSDCTDPSLFTKVVDAIANGPLDAKSIATAAGITCDTTFHDNRGKRHSCAGKVLFLITEARANGNLIAAVPNPGDGLTTFRLVKP